MCLKEIVHAGIELGMPLAQRCDFCRCDTRAHFKPLTNSGSETIEVTGVQPSRLPRLDARKNLARLGPPFRIDGAPFKTESLQLANRRTKTFHDLRLAIVEKALSSNRKTGVCLDHGRGFRSVKLSEQGCVLEITKEPAERVKRF